MIKKRIIKTLILFFVVFTIVGLIGYILFNIIPPNNKIIEKHFELDKANLDIVVDFLINAEYNEIYINRFNFNEDKMFTGVETKDEKINDETVLKSLKYLFDYRGYMRIGKSGNTIYFDKWMFGEETRGLAYSINDTDEPIVEFLTNLEPLSENQWFYFEADYNEWRSNQK